MHRSLPGLQDSSFENLRLLDHPLAAHKLAYMRNRNCSINLFRQLTRELGIFLAYEAARDMPVIPASDPSLEARGLPQTKPVVIPILRAGLTLAEGALEVMPAARVGHMGFRRDTKPGREHEAIPHLIVLPELLQRSFFLMDMGIGTGSTADLAIQILRNEKVRPEDIRFCAVLVSSRGMARLATNHPNVIVHAIALEDQGEDGFLDTGFGDANNRLFGIE